MAWRRAGRPAGGPVPAADGATIDDYAAWAATSDGAAAPGPSDAGALCDLALGFAGDAGEVAGALGKLRDGDTRQAERFVGELGDVAHFWARLALAIGIQPSALLAQSRADTER
ncbi:MAG: pyrophosphatase [Alphaproteobacteria bacterium]|nr:pyrophosphatase [Alphaproteobacteria bacterium]